MPRLARAVSACLATLALGACALSATEGDAQSERLYRTGSNIAQREHSMPGNVQTKQVDTGDPNLGLPQAGRLPRSFGGGG
jgi:hypothetical protein